jgi:hypothetical protein
MSNKPLLALTLLLAAAVSARQAPVDRSWRSLGMGGAGIAVADDADAVHLNPAGLAQIGWGPFAPLDSIHYKRDKVDAWLLGIGFDPGPENLLDLWRFWNRYKGSIDSGKNDPKTLLQNQQMLNDIYKFDRKPMPIDASVDVGGAVHDLGAAFWNKDEVILLLDRGAITPKAAATLRTTSAIEAGTGTTFLDDRLCLGIGYRVVAVSSEERQYDIIELRDQASNAPRRMVLNSVSDLRRTEDWGHGLDLGFIWFQTPSLRFGGSVRDLGMKLDDESVTPNLTLGMAWAPRPFQRNDLWARKINFGIAADDLLWDTLGYKPLSKIDVGFEWMQTVIPVVLVGRISAGLHGGYPSLLVSGTLMKIFRGEFLTYAEETGYFTGDRETRYWMVRLGVGF